RTDVYATGIMLFELLTGTQPYQAETPLAVAYKHVDNVVPSPSSLAPGLPPALDALVALATSRNPDRRPADAGQFLRAITEVRRGRPLAGSHAGGPSGTAQYPTGGQPTGGHHTGGHRVDDGGGGPGGSGPGGAGRGVSGLDPALTPGSMAGPLPGIGPDPRSSAVTFPPGAGPASFPLGAGPGTGSVPGAAPGGPRTDPPWAEPGTGFPSSYPYPGPAGGYPADTGSAGRGEPRHGRPAHARKVEILPAVVSGPMAAVPLGSMRPDAGPMIPAPIGTGPLGSGLMSTVPPGSPYDAMNHTLIVSGADPASGPPDGARTRRGRTPGRRYDRQREPFLQRWLFSRRLAYLAAAFAVILTVGLVTWWNTAGQYTTVPQVAGLTKSTARQELRNLGFTVRSGPGVHSNSVPRGEIVRTSPAIGARTHKGVAITIIPSLGAFRVKVPPVTGMKLADANAALRKAGLIPGPVTNATSTTIPAGVVISTHPAAGQTWPQTRPVALVQSAGQPVPNMVGEQLSEAQAQAQQLGFQLNPKDNKHSDQPAGTITSQAIRPGGPITPGEVITVRVSTGPRMVDVPNVIGLDEQAADNLMLQAGFQISISQQGLGHRVVGYSPMGQAPIGSTITLLVGFSF
ncbi:MAG: PASTA domain-containing protein, partial [Actinomycetota bacterium]